MIILRFVHLMNSAVLAVAAVSLKLSKDQRIRFDSLYLQRCEGICPSEYTTLTSEIVLRFTLCPASGCSHLLFFCVGDCLPLEKTWELCG